MILNPAFEHDLQEFLDGPLCNKWLSNHQFEIYVRKGIHNVNGVSHKFLNIANIEVHEELRGRGIFKKVLALCQQMTPFDGVYVESILSPELFFYLSKLTKEEKGWTYTGGTNSFAWMVE